MALASILGRNISKRRRALGLRQSDVAQKASITQGYLSDLERGVEANVGLETLDRIASVLNTRVCDLLSDSNAEELISLPT